MSGGHFGYAQYRIDDIASDVERLIETNGSTEKDEFGDYIGYHFDSETIEKFKEAHLTLRKAAAMAQRIDWLVSGDDGEDSFHRRWDEELSEITSND